MSESDRLDSKKLWLWLDFETTGLDVSSLTVVEAGWTITRKDLTQVCAVKSRFCAFGPPSATHYVTPNDLSWSYIDEVVIRMHTDSGLTEAYCEVPRALLLSSMGVLDRLIFDDLFEAGWDGESKLVLAGAGLAGFDRRVLVECRSQVLSFAHYRSADTSVACEILGIPVPKDPEGFDLLMKQYPADGFSDVVYSGGLSAETPVHRAGADVAAALRVARALRCAVSSS